MESASYFTEYEQKIIGDRKFLETKHQIIDKVHYVLDRMQGKLRQELLEHPSSIALPCDIQSGKISRGENYAGMPWLVSDYPRHFSRKAVFAFRVMFWWGHHFSFNLHIQGGYLPEFREYLEKKTGLLRELKFWLATGSTPWTYDFEGGEFVYLPDMTDKEVKVIMHDQAFIRLGRPVSLNIDPEEFINEGVRVFRILFP